MQRSIDVTREETAIMAGSNQGRNKTPGKRGRGATTPDRKYMISDALLQPWFLSLETAKAVLRLIPQKHFSRMRWFFEDFGCLRCRGKKLEYGGNCLCARCRHAVMRCMIRSVERRSKTSKGSKPPSPRRGYLDRAEAAKKLLGDLAASGL